MRKHLNKLCESSESSDSSSAKYASTTELSEDEAPNLKTRKSDVQTVHEIEQSEQSFYALGSRPDSQDNVGKELHEEIVIRWDSLLKKGLSKDQREELMTKFKIPSNCKALQPPQINKEVQPCLIKSVLEHDRFMRALQQQLAHGLSAVEAVIKTIMPYKEQLFTNVHHGLSVHRRFNIIPHLNPECKKVVDNLEIDDFLFNTKFAETMKNEQAIKKASTDFKKKTWHANLIGPPGSGIPNSYHLNYRRALPNGREEGGRREERTTEAVQKRPQEVLSPEITARTNVFPFWSKNVMGMILQNSNVQFYSESRYSLF
ncbi:unnamed protein product [Acanthoscelides obtectus]|uniref:Uncharacterized protein n=1 Tax=Acanthoscelides obtectus TaxID=200917 RepID=A0A9P0JW77_ACAOB|nr:unnamed protein product [Acanthoscelides obtectus]CAK1663447.1 hypothetical protein AOBTE_LOCUS23667 [Acanthoscelides obtectus]